MHATKLIVHYGNKRSKIKTITKTNSHFNNFLFDQINVWVK